MKEFRVYLMIFCFGFLSHVELLSQEFKKYMARLDTQEVDGKTLIVSWFDNNSTAPLLIKYEAVIELKDKGNELKRGITLTLPATPTLLTKAVFTLVNKEFEAVHLTVTNREDEILAADHIAAPDLNQQLTKVKKTTELPLTVPLPLNRKNTEDIEIEGLVLDETRSKLARDFYELFYRNWSTANIDAKGSAITIREMPGRIGIGTSILVLVDDKSIMLLNLQPRGSVVEELASQLVEALENYLNDPANRSVIEGGDLTGSGIY